MNTMKNRIKHQGVHGEVEHDPWVEIQGKFVGAPYAEISLVRVFCGSEETLRELKTLLVSHNSQQRNSDAWCLIPQAFFAPQVCF